MEAVHLGFELLLIKTSLSIKHKIFINVAMTVDCHLEINGYNI